MLFCCTKLYRPLTARIGNRIHLFMVALWNRADHYKFHPVVSSSIFYLLSSFFPRLISATVDWMSTILRHMVWP